MRKGIDSKLVERRISKKRAGGGPVRKEKRVPGRATRQ